MTWAGRLATVIPALFFGIIVFCLVRFIQNSTWINGIATIAAVYILPLFVYRLHNWIFPLVDLIQDIQVKAYSPWWTSHQIQMIYIALPILEGPLHLVPGLFSWWLRAWGSQIGRGVYWTPQVQVVDRGMLVIGDGVVVGHLAGFCSHAISPIKGRLSLIVQRIHVGRGAFLGAECRLGPGSKVAEGEMIKAQTCLYWKGVVP